MPSPLLGLRCEADAVESFASSGWFWLPRTPDRRVHGDLVVDEADIQLQVGQSLRGPTPISDTSVGGPMQWATEPVVHGCLRNGEDVTLLQLAGLASPVDVASEGWSASFALTGAGLAADDRFTHVLFDLDHLLPWVQPSGILRSGLTAPVVEVDTQRSTLAEAAIPDGRIVRILTGVTGRRSDTAIHLDQWCAFEVEGGPTRLVEILNDWVRPLQDLLVVCIGVPVRLADVRLGAGLELRLSFQAVQRQAAAVPIAPPDSYSSPTLLTYARSPVPFAALMTQWFALCDELPAAITLLCGPYYAPFIYSQHRYASTFQSAEAIAIAEMKRREKEPGEHRLRVEAVTAALQAANLDAKTVGWATRILQGRNEKPLRQLIEELIAATGAAGNQLLAAMPDLSQRAADARVGVSHPLDGHSAVLERHWIGEALTWVARLHLLARLGLDMTDLSGHVIEKPMFGQILAELRALAGG
jgi:ApeA N-terminal domain 1